MFQRWHARCNLLICIWGGNLLSKENSESLCTQPCALFSISLFAVSWCSCSLNIVPLTNLLKNPVLKTKLRARIFKNVLHHIPQIEMNIPERVIRHDCVDFRTSHAAGTLPWVFTSSPITDFKKSFCETSVHLDRGLQLSESSILSRYFFTYPLIYMAKTSMG